MDEAAIVRNTPSKSNLRVVASEGVRIPDTDACMEATQQAEDTLRDIHALRRAARGLDLDDDKQAAAFARLVAPLIGRLPEDWVIGLQSLAEAQRARLARIRTQPLGVDKQGRPINSIRRLAAEIGQSHTHLSNYARGKSFPCIVIMNAVATKMDMEFVVPNFQKPDGPDDTEPRRDG